MKVSLSARQLLNNLSLAALISGDSVSALKTNGVRLTVCALLPSDILHQARNGEDSVLPREGLQALMVVEAVSGNWCQYLTPCRLAGNLTAGEFASYSGEDVPEVAQRAIVSRFSGDSGELPGDAFVLWRATVRASSMLGILRSKVNLGVLLELRSKEAGKKSTKPEEYFLRDDAVLTVMAGGLKADIPPLWDASFPSVPTDGEVLASVPVPAAAFVAATKLSATHCPKEASVSGLRHVHLELAKAEVCRRELSKLGLDEEVVEKLPRQVQEVLLPSSNVRFSIAVGQAAVSAWNQVNLPPGDIIPGAREIIPDDILRVALTPSAVVLLEKTVNAVASDLEWSSESGSSEKPAAGEEVPVCVELQFLNCSAKAYAANISDSYQGASSNVQHSPPRSPTVLRASGPSGEITVQLCSDDQVMNMGRHAARFVVESFGLLEPNGSGVTFEACAPSQAVRSAIGGVLSLASGEKNDEGGDITSKCKLRFLRSLGVEAGITSDSKSTSGIGVALAGTLGKGRDYVPGVVRPWGKTVPLEEAASLDASVNGGVVSKILLQAGRGLSRMYMREGKNFLLVVAGEGPAHVEDSEDDGQEVLSRSKWLSTLWCSQLWEAPVVRVGDEL